MRGPTELCVTGMGAVSAVGLTALQTFTSVRAGINRFRTHPFHYSLIDPPFLDEPEPLTCASAPILDPMDREPDRLLNMALAALEGVFTEAGISRRELSQTSFFVALGPRTESGPDWELEKHFLPEFFRRAAIKPFAQAQMDRSGATGFTRALLRAQEALATPGVRFALVGGVDSFLDEDRVKKLDAEYRLKSSRNRDGFIPGEGAAFLLMESEENARSRGAKIWGRIHGVATAQEEQPFNGDRSSTGTGLTQAIRSTLQASGKEPHWLVCDLNGESYRGYEWGLTRVRAGQALDGLRDVWHPADCFGDVGAASLPLYTILACQAFDRGYAPGSNCLLFAGDDGGERGAFMVCAEAGSQRGG